MRAALAALLLIVVFLLGGCQQPDCPPTGQQLNRDPLPSGCMEF